MIAYFSSFLGNNLERLGGELCAKLTLFQVFVPVFGRRP